MEIIEEDDEEIRELMLKISRKEITICETCDSVFKYATNKKICDKCRKKKLRAYRKRPGERERLREYHQRPEVKEKARMRKQSPESKEQQRLYRQRPEIKIQRNKQYLRRKKLRENK
jgi:hypothetical protein